MNTELLGVWFPFVVVIILSIPLGKYIGKVFSDEKTWLDPLLHPLDRLIYRIGGIDPNREMPWKKHLTSLLLINAVWFVLSMIVLTNMSWLPLNPDHNPSMPLDLAFNTSISFITNTNLQHYSGEGSLSYLGQLTLLFWQFISAGTGIAICILAFKALKEQTTSLGNFYTHLVKSCTRILFPIALVVAIILLFSGIPMTFEGKDSVTGLQGQTIEVSRGPMAAFVAIKHLGTNGGGFFGANSAHPFENPSYFTNSLLLITQMILPLALIVAFGYILRRKKLAYMILGVMTLGFIALTIPTIHAEMQGNPLLKEMGIAQPNGNMEGKEMRFGAAASGYWSIATTVISTGSVNSMHDSFTPTGTMSQLIAMMVNSFYGGCGVGFLNFFIFIILAVFISGLMVGRTPEFLGKKIEAKEMKIAMAIALLHPFLILVGSALATYGITQHPATNATWLANQGHHGFSEMLYEFTSSSANNGSGMEGLGDNTPFWNIATGIVMLLGRYLPIIGPVAIAGILHGKKYIPESAGTLKTDTSTFAIMIVAVIIIVAALSFFPALTLGPIAEHFSMH